MTITGAGEGQGKTAKVETAQKRVPFYITKDEERQLRIDADRLSPSLVINQAVSFDEYVRQLMVPPTVMDLARKASEIRFSAWEVEAVRAQLEPGGLLREILELKSEHDKSHPPYIRVACTGKSDYDYLAENYGFLPAPEHGDAGSPAVLEIWPAQHYSPMHSHGGTTGIIYCLTGQIDVMAYSELNWNAKKLGLLTLTPGQCAWLAGDQFAVHKVYCPMDGGSKPVGGPGNKNMLNDTSDYAATFHVYLNEDETIPDKYVPAKPGTREKFEFINEQEPHEPKPFTTYSDLSWHVLRKVMAEYSPN